MYDVNTNTNYNPEAEQRAGRAGTERSGPGAIAAFLGNLSHEVGEDEARRATRVRVIGSPRSTGCVPARAPLPSVLRTIDPRV